MESRLKMIFFQFYINFDFQRIYALSCKSFDNSQERFRNGSQEYYSSRQKSCKEYNSQEYMFLGGIIIPISFLGIFLEYYSQFLKALLGIIIPRKTRNIPGIVPTSGNIIPIIPGIFQEHSWECFRNYIPIIPRNYIPFIPGTVPEQFLE